MTYQEIIDKNEKIKIARTILEALNEWFGILEARENYINHAIDKVFFAAYDNQKPVGFVYIEATSKDTIELSVIGVLKEYHRRGIGKYLFNLVQQYAKNNNYSFIQVKTVQMGKYLEYDETNKFYQSLGFKELEVFPTLWDEFNPCQIYIMSV